MSRSCMPTWNLLSLSLYYIGCWYILTFQCKESCLCTFVRYRPFTSLYFALSLFYNYIDLYNLFLLSCSKINNLSFYTIFWIICFSQTHFFGSLLLESIFDVQISVLWFCMCIIHYSTLFFTQLWVCSCLFGVGVLNL